MIESVRRSGTRLTVRGRLTGAPSARYTVEIFANRVPGSGEGELYLGDVVTMSDAAGNGIFSFIVDAAQVGAMPATFTATLTSSRDGATSEFSKPVGVSE